MKHIQSALLRLRTRFGMLRRNSDLKAERAYILSSIGERVSREKILFLRKPLTVLRDYLGIEVPYTVRSVKRLSEMSPASREFSLGKDEYGIPVTTDELSTGDLKRLLLQL